MSYTTVPIFSEQPQREPFVPHTAYLPDRWSGVLWLRWTVEKSSPIIIGSGHLEFEKVAPPPPPDLPLLSIPVRPRKIPGMKRMTAYLATPPQRREPPPEVVSGIVRRRGKPVLLGSSLKGASRQAYELLTPSCQPGAWGRSCTVKQKARRAWLCPACSLFGAAGYGGRLTFSETGSSGSVETDVRRVPEAWPPQKKPVKGNKYRVHRLAKDTDKDGEDRKVVEKVRCAWGAFESRIFVTNATVLELGILFLALGLDVAEGPGLRVGGKKFHGFGGVQASITAADHLTAGRGVQRIEDAATWASELRGWALGDAKRRRAWEALQAAIRAH